MKVTKNRNHRKISLALAATVALGFLAGCGKSEESATPSSMADSEKTARLTYVNWAEGVAYTHLAKLVLEEKMGYDVEITSADVGPAYIAVADGKYDAYMECWRDLHQDYLENAGDRVISLGNVYEGTVLGLAVPSYVTIDTIAEIKGNEDKFGGRIVGIDPGAGMMKAIEADLIPDYDLDITLIPSSGPAMTAALGKAISEEEWIVVPSWKPHWMFGRWDLKILEQDPDNAIWKEGDIEIIGRYDIDQDKPELAAFLRNMFVTDAQISDLMFKIEDSDLPLEEVVSTWMDDNEDVVEAWIPKT